MVRNFWGTGKPVIIQSIKPGPAENGYALPLQTV